MGKKHNQRKGTESYEVKYWIQEGEFWKQRTKIMDGYFTKSSHENVKMDFKKLHPSARIVSVAYQ